MIHRSLNVRDIVHGERGPWLPRLSCAHVHVRVWAHRHLPHLTLIGSLDAPTITDALKELRVKPEQLAHASVNEAYTMLTNLGFARGSVGAFNTTVRTRSDCTWGLLYCAGCVWVSGSKGAHALLGPAMHLRAASLP